MNKKIRAKCISFLLAAAMLFTFFPTAAYAADPDTTPPAFLPGYPMVGAPQGAGSRQVRVVIGAQEAAYHSFVLLPDGAAAPTREQVAAGQDASGSPALSARSSGASKYTTIDTGTYAPLHGTAYDIYVVLRDDAGNISEPAKVDVTTPPAADFFAPGYPMAGAAQAQGSRQVQVLVKFQNTQVDGKVYYTLVPDGDPAPTIEQIRDGKGGTGEPPVASGSATAAKGNEFSLLVSGDGDACDYDLYLVAGDTYYASPLAACTEVVKLDVTTPPAVQPAVCAIGGAQYASLGDALAAVQSGQTIRLLTNISYGTGIVVEGKSISFDLNGFTLDVNNMDPNTADGAGLEVLNGGGVSLSDAGALNVTGIHYGAFVSSDSQTASATVTNATAATYDGEAARAYGNAVLTVLGNATATGEMGTGVRALEGAAITVSGNATGKAIGAYAQYASVTVEGNVIAAGTPNAEMSTGNGVGAYGGAATVRGDVIAANIGAGAWDGGNVTVDGVITAPQYIELAYNIIGIDDYQPVTTKQGYRTYSQQDPESPVTSTVWVKEPLATTYTLTVENGTGDGSYAPGTTMNIAADAAPSGKVFDHWATQSSGTFADAASPATTFIMPAEAATVTAVYRDQSAPPSVGHTITASAGDGGSISPSGAIPVSDGGSQSFTITPDSDYSISSVTVDGVGQGAVSSYTFGNVTGDHTISVTFRHTDAAGDNDDRGGNADAVTAKNPHTGDSGHESMWWLFYGIPAYGMILQIVKKTRRRKKSENV